MNKLKATLPMALVVGVLALLWVELSLNATFHWLATDQLGNGLALPGNLHLVAPAAFVTWAAFFAAGADSAALVKTVAGAVIGATGALVVMLVAPKVAPLPDFWGIALVLGVVVFAAVALSAIGDWYYVPAIFGSFAAVVFWWIATGLDGWAEGGGGKGNSLKALTDPATAGAGAFGGVLSVPAVWVYVSVLLTLICGAVLGVLSVRLTAMITPKQRDLQDASAR